MPETRVLIGDALDMLRTLPAASVQCVVTSPPYYGLRSYLPAGHPDKAREIGAEDTPDAYVRRLVEVMREVRRVLRDDGVLWLNIGDSYAGSWGNQGRKETRGGQRPVNGPMLTPVHDGRYRDKGSRTGAIPPGAAYKAKDLLMIPARVALALQADGWWLRSETVWAKRNPMPESCKDRPTGAHEKLFLLTKRADYFFDGDAIREPHASDYSRDIIAKAGGAGGARPAGNNFSKAARHAGETTPRTRAARAALLNPGGRNARNVQSWLPTPYKGAHYAVMPVGMADWCIRAGSRPGDMVLDPFGGAGTVAVAASALGRDCLLIDLDPRNEALIRERLAAPAQKAPKKRAATPSPMAPASTPAPEPPLLAAIAARDAA